MKKYEVNFYHQSVISCKEITKEVMSKERIDVIEDIIYCINHQHYVVIYLNENLIPNMRHYQHKAIVHGEFSVRMLLIRLKYNDVIM